MHRFILFFAVFMPVVMAPVAMADVPPQQRDEVEHLIEFVGSSGCIINRNGTDHPSDKAINHIRKKYDYFRDDIRSTEDFIKYSATKSTLSGKHYTVTCPGYETVTTQQWLLDELARYRQQKVSRPKAGAEVRCPEKRSPVCTREYRPVCARLRDGGTETYANGCEACANTRVTAFTPGACPE